MSGCATNTFNFIGNQTAAMWKLYVVIEESCVWSCEAVGRNLHYRPI
jgi:hypothetical protein